jgi:hypothetical protein
MKYISLSFFSVLFVACSSNKTVFVSNKLNTPITLSADSTYLSSHGVAFKDSLNGKRIESSLVINFGKGKWSKEDKAELENTLRRMKMLSDGNDIHQPLPKDLKMRHISLSVEELWVIIK